MNSAMAGIALAPRCSVPPAVAAAPSISDQCARFRLGKQMLGCSLLSSSENELGRKPIWGRRRSSSFVCRLKSLAESEALTTDPDELSKLPAAQGVYAVYDQQGELQFVGMSRRISASVQGHARDLPELCRSVKVAVVEGVDREGLKQAWQAWVEEHLMKTGNVPSGNAPGNTTWTARRKAIKNDLKMKPSRNTELTITLEELIDTVVKSHGVVAFIKGSRTAPQCGFSQRVLTLLEQQGVDYETVNVLDEDHNFGVREAVKNYSRWPTIPQVFVKGEFVGGADVLNEMAESGEISKLFAKK